MEFSVAIGIPIRFSWSALVMTHVSENCTVDGRHCNKHQIELGCWRLQAD